MIWIEDFIRHKTQNLNVADISERIWKHFSGSEKNDLEMLESISPLAYTSNEAMLEKEGKRKNLWGELDDFLLDSF